MGSQVFVYLSFSLSSSDRFEVDLKTLEVFTLTLKILMIVQLEIEETEKEFSVGLRKVM